MICNNLLLFFSLYHPRSFLVYVTSVFFCCCCCCCWGFFYYFLVSFFLTNYYFILSSILKVIFYSKHRDVAPLLVKGVALVFINSHITPMLHTSRQCFMSQCEKNCKEKRNILLTRSPVASLEIFVLTREYLLQKSIKLGVITRQLCSSIDVVVDSVWRIMFVVAVEVTLSPFGEILPVSRHGVGIIPSLACLL